MLSNFQLFGSSVQYIPIAILIFIYAALLRKSEQNLSDGLFIGATVLCVSIFLELLMSQYAKWFQRELILFGIY